MTIQPILAAWSPLPLAAKLGVGVAVIALVALVSGGVGGLVSRYKDARFDKAEAARAEERSKLELDRDAALRRAEAAEAKAQILEVQAVALKQVAENAALTAKQSQQKADQISRETAAAVEAISDLPPDQAQRDIYDRLVRLGLLKEPQ